MQGISSMVMCLVLLVASFVQVSLAQTTHVVGDGLGWIVPSGGPIAYQTWTATRVFSVGDVLLFNFTTGAHDVVEVTNTEFDSCNTTSTNIINTGPASITLTTTGEHYYICAVPRHCSFGQRLAINVTAGSSTISPAPGPRGSTPTTQVVAPPPNSSSSFVSAVLPFTFLAVIVAFFL